MNEEYSFMVDKDGNFYRVEYVPVVRCGDCKHGYHIVNSIKGNITLYRVFCTKPYVERGNATHEPDWFCADGVMKGKDDG